MPDSTRRPSPDAQADQRIQEILRAADSWSREAPRALMPAIRAVCIRLAEMVADRLRSKPVTEGMDDHLKALEELELRSTGSWAIVASAQTEWITTAIRYLEGQAVALPAGDRPDPYWADDVVAGIIASVRALIGVDELHARTEARYSGPVKRITPDEE